MSDKLLELQTSVKDDQVALTLIVPLEELILPSDMLLAKLSPSSSDNVVDVLNRRSEQISSTAVTMRSDAEYFAIYSKKTAV